MAAHSSGVLTLRNESSSGSMAATPASCTNNVRTLGKSLRTLFVFPSYHEGNPGALVEAMLAGLPVVASDIPAHREIVQAGETGLLAPPQEARILAETTQWALTHQNAMAEMGERAQRLAVKRFDIACIAQQFETLCQDTVAQWRAAH